MTVDYLKVSESKAVLIEQKQEVHTDEGQGWID